MVSELFRAFQRFLEVFRGFQRFSEVFRGLQRFFQRPSQRPSQSAIFLSELRVVLPLIVLPLKTPARGVLKSMGNKVPWKIGTLIYLPVPSRPFISLQKEAVLSPCNFTTAHLTACILTFYLPLTSRPMKRRTLFATPQTSCFLNSSRIKSALTRYRAPRWPDPEFPLKKKPKNTPRAETLQTTKQTPGNRQELGA